MLSRSRAAAGVEQLPSTFVNVRVVVNFNLSDCCKREEQLRRRRNVGWGREKDKREATLSRGY